MNITSRLHNADRRMSNVPHVAEIERRRARAEVASKKSTVAHNYRPPSKVRLRLNWWQRLILRVTNARKRRAEQRELLQIVKRAISPFQK